MDEKTIVLNSTGAVGDLVIASALIPKLKALGYTPGIVSKAFTLPLWNSLEALTFDSKEAVPKDAQFFDISDYLLGFPHSNRLRAEGETGEGNHLCQWMAYSLYKKSGIQIFPSRDDVKIDLTAEEIFQAQRTMREVSGEHNNLPVLAITPYSNTKNRNIPKRVLDEVMRGVSGFAVPYLMDSFKPDQIRNFAALLFCADAYLGIDSGPLHMVNGALQGSNDDGLFLNTDKRKVIAVLGSSHPDCVAYNGNQIILGGCDISPCGSHGYFGVESYEQEFGRKFYTTGKDKSGCIFSDYNEAETSRCMEAVSADEIIEKVRETINFF